MSDKPELPDKGDIPIAYRAVCLASISGGAKQIAAIILGHFNLKTGQCDPGTETLMRRANLSKRAVVNATDELDRIGLVVKYRHGGNGFRSRYQPNWTLFRDIVDAFERGETASEIVQKSALTRCTKVHLGSAEKCTLTKLRNSSKKLKETNTASGRVDPPKDVRSAATVDADRVHGLLKRIEIGSRPSTRIPPSVVSARAEAWMKIDRWLDGLSTTTREAIDRIWTDAIQQDAITAEQKTRGAGPDLIMDCVARRTPVAGRR